MFARVASDERHVLQEPKTRVCRGIGPRRVRSCEGDARTRRAWQVRRRWTKEAKSRWVKIMRRSSGGRARRWWGVGVVEVEGGWARAWTCGGFGSGGDGDVEAFIAAGATVSGDSASAVVVVVAVVAADVVEEVEFLVVEGCAEEEEA